MIFTSEDRKEVFHFFENILLKTDKPIFYEHLRGHVAKASPIVKKFVHLECKGDKLLKFFETRKTYFIVDKYDISLRRKRHVFPLNWHCSKENSEKDRKLNLEAFGADGFSPSRSKSLVSSLAKTGNLKSNGCAVNSSSVTTEKAEYEVITLKYFEELLLRKHKIKIDTIDLETLPKKVKRYLIKYVKKKIILFFQSNPRIFHIDSENFVCLIDYPPSSQEASCNKDNVSVELKTTIDDSYLIDNSLSLDSEAQNIENFLKCTDFFVGILKRKQSPLHVDKLSGYLSQAPKDTLKYLKSNYKSFKLFFEDAPMLFVLNENKEIRLSSDCFKLLKRAKKVLRLKPKHELLCMPIESALISIFEPPPRLKSYSAAEEVANEFYDNQSDVSMQDLHENLDLSECEYMEERDVNDLCDKQINDLEDKNDIGKNLKFSDNKPIGEDRVIKGSQINDLMDEKDSNENSELSYFELFGTKDAGNGLYENKKNNQQDEKVLPEEDSELSESGYFEEERTVSACVSQRSDFQNDKLLDYCSFESTEDSELLNSMPVLAFSNNIPGNKSDYNFSTVKKPIMKYMCDSKESRSQQLEEFAKTADNFTCYDTQIKTQRSFIEVIYTAQLLCLEVRESEFIFDIKHNYEAIKFFAEILERLPDKKAEFNSLKGTLGKAPVEVQSFIKELYKGNSIKCFFEKHEEFIVGSNSSWVKLSPAYDSSLCNRLKLQRKLAKGEKVYDINTLFDTEFYKLYVDIIKCVSVICKFLQNKSKTKLTRLSGITSILSPSQQDFIKSFQGGTICEKLENFLRLFQIFVFVENCIAVNTDCDVSLLINSIAKLAEKVAELELHKNLPNYVYISDCFPYEYKKVVLLKDSYLKYSVTEYLKDFLCGIERYIYYSHLPKILDPAVFVTLLFKRRDSQYLMNLLEDSDLFQIENKCIKERITMPEREFSDGNSDKSDYEDENILIHILFHQQLKLNQTADNESNNQSLMNLTLKEENACSNIEEESFENSVHIENCLLTNFESNIVMKENISTNTEEQSFESLTHTEDGVLPNFEAGISIKEENECINIEDESFESLAHSEDGESNISIKEEDVCTNTEEKSFQSLAHSEDGVITNPESGIFIKEENVCTNIEEENFESLAHSENGIIANFESNNFIKEENIRANTEEESLESLAHSEEGLINNFKSNISIREENVYTNAKESFESSTHNEDGIMTNFESNISMNSNSRLNDESNLENLSDPSLMRLPPIHLEKNTSNQDIVNDEKTRYECKCQEISSRANDNSTSDLKQELSSGCLQQLDFVESCSENFADILEPQCNIDFSVTNVFSDESSGENPEIQFETKVGLSPERVLSKKESHSSSPSNETSEMGKCPNTSECKLKYDYTERNSSIEGFARVFFPDCNKLNMPEESMKILENISYGKECDQEIDVCRIPKLKTCSSQVTVDGGNSLLNILVSEIEYFSDFISTDELCAKSAIDDEIVKNKNKFLYKNPDNQSEKLHNGFSDILPHSQIDTKKAVTEIQEISTHSLPENKHNSEFIFDELSDVIKEDHSVVYNEYTTRNGFDFGAAKTVIHKNASPQKADVVNISVCDVKSDVCKDNQTVDTLNCDDIFKSIEENVEDTRIQYDISSHSKLHFKSNVPACSEHVTKKKCNFVPSETVIYESASHQKNDMVETSVSEFKPNVFNDNQNNLYDNIDALKEKYDDSVQSVKGNYIDDTGILSDIDSFCELHSKNVISVCNEGICRIVCNFVAAETVIYKNTSHQKDIIMETSVLDVYEDVQNMDLCGIDTLKEKCDDSAKSVEKNCGKCTKIQGDTESHDKLHSKINVSNSSAFMKDVYSVNNSDNVDSSDHEVLIDTINIHVNSACFYDNINSNDVKLQSTKLSGDLNKTPCSVSNFESFQNKSTDLNIHSNQINKTDSFFPLQINSPTKKVSINTDNENNGSECFNNSTKSIDKEFISPTIDDKCASNPFCLPSHSELIKSYEQNQVINPNVLEKVSSQKVNTSFLQPLYARITLLAIDSFVLETIINDKKTNVFCLRSSFHCDKHDNCSKCYDLLAVGDKVLCYLPPTEAEYKLGSMYFAFMVCVDADSANENIEDANTVIAKGLSKRYKSKYFSTDYDNSAVNDSFTESSENVSSFVYTEMTNVHSGEYQPLSGTIKSRCTAYDAACQVNCEVFTLGCQTVNEFHAKGCQTDISSDIKCCSNFESVECQTSVSRLIKQCVNSADKYCQSSYIVCDTECQVEYKTTSLGTQTVIKSKIQDSQTDITGSIKSYFDTESSECQTSITGPINQYVHSADKYCQSVFNLVSQMTQTSKDAFKLDQVSQEAMNIDFQSYAESSENLDVKITVDNTCQTISTGDIWMKKQYLY